MNYVIADLIFGDGGKGTTTEAVVRKFDAEIVGRYNGGPQCRHNVVESNGRHHCFSQFGSATLLPNIKTFLSKYMLVNLLSLAVEERVLRAKGIDDAYARLIVDPMAKIILPHHEALNKLRELSRGSNRHGSCGMGIGEAVADYSIGTPIYVLDCLDKAFLAEKINLVSRRLAAEADQFTNLKSHWSDIFNGKADRILVDELHNIVNKFTIADASVLNIFTRRVWEGGQGIGLDQDFGFHPFTTWSQTTMINVEKILIEAGLKFDDVVRIGVCRTFTTRHGRGPLPSEMTKVDKNFYFSRFDTKKEHNQFNDWQGIFRLGFLDLSLLEYALTVNEGLDYLSITHIDALPDDTVPIQKDYTLQRPKSLDDQQNLTNQLNEMHKMLRFVRSKNVPEIISQRLNTPILIQSTGPTFEDKKFNDRT